MTIVYIFILDHPKWRNFWTFGTLAANDPQKGANPRKRSKRAIWIKRAFFLMFSAVSSLNMSEPRIQCWKLMDSQWCRRNKPWVVYWDDNYPFFTAVSHVCMPDSNTRFGRSDQKRKKQKNIFWLQLVVSSALRITPCNSICLRNLAEVSENRLRLKQHDFF